MAKILIADDRPINREFLTTLLGYGGHQLLEAGDGAEALVQVRSEHPDLVIADVLMPVMDGYEFVRQMRLDPDISGTPVIFFTASYHEREARKLAASCGVDHVITKPAEPAQILIAVSQALGATQQPVLAPKQDFEQEHLRLLTDKLSLSANELEASNQRLADLLEASGLLAAERDSEHILAKLCSTARDIIGARFAFLGVLPEDKRLMKPLFVSGLDTKTAEALGPIDAGHGLLARLLEQSMPLRFSDSATTPSPTDFPTPGVTAHSFMGIRLSTSTGIYGLLWFLEKLGGGEFNDADERVLASLSNQAGVAYENAQRYQEIQRYAAELEHRVEERTAKLRDANKDLEAFNYSVAHDLRGPLRHIKGFSEILEEDCGEEMEPEARGCLGKIQQSASRMSLLIDDLLRLSQVGRQDLSRQPTDLSLVVRETAQEIESDNKGRSIEWKIEPLPQVDCDPVLIKQVFVNLLANAVKYSRPRPLAIIEVGTIQEKDSPVFFVRDNGVGFDMKYADKLFGVFQRLHRQEEFEGTGAGLAIVQRVIGRHHGRIWAEAAVDQGATFYFTIGARSSGDGPSNQAA